MRGTCNCRDTSQKSQLHSLLPFQGREPPDLGRSDLDTQSQGDPGYVHTVNSTPIAAVEMLTRRVPERGVTVSAHGSGGGRPWPAVTMRDFWLLERWYV